MSITKFDKLRIWAPEDEIEPQALPSSRTLRACPGSSTTSPRCPTSTGAWARRWAP